MDEHHKGIPFTGCILLLFKECVHQLWGIRNEEIKVSGETKIFLDYIFISNFENPKQMTNNTGGILYKLHTK